MKRLIISIILVVWCVCIWSQNYAGFYTYPFSIKDEQWQKYKNNKERIDAMQIPEIKLSGIPTVHLLEICLDYPFLLEFTFNDDYQEGVNTLIQEFNGFKELINRDDLPDVLLAKEFGLAKEVELVLAEDDLSKGSLGFKNLIVDLLLLREDVFSKLTENQKNNLLIVFTKNNIIKQNHPNIFGSVNFISDRVLSNMKPQSRLFRSYPEYAPVNIYTPKGSLVPDAWILTSGDVSYSTTEITNLTNTIYNLYNGAELKEAPTYQYNDKGYAWYKYETSQNVAIGYYNAFADTIYWADNSYIEIPASISSIATIVKYVSSTFTAVKEDDSWYVSKWRYDGPLVRHHPTDIPSYLNPSSPRKYYMRNPNCSINGAKLINSGSTSYSVANLPAGFTVTWSLSDNYYNQYCLQQNSPSANQCTITYSSSHNMFPGILTADIKYSGTTVLSITKNIYAYMGFVGTYTSSMGSGQFVAPNPIFTVSNSMVHIFSPSLIGATVTYTGDATPNYWLPGYDTIDLGMPSSGSTIVIHVSCADGNAYTIPVIRVSKSNNMSIGFDRDMMTITQDGPLLENQEWELEIFNVANDEKIITRRVSGNFVSLNTSGWKSGLYVVRAIFGKEVITEKIKVK